MGIVDIKVDASGALRGLEEFEREQLPFVLALSLTRTAQAGQADVQDLEGKVFRLRNDWTVRNTKIVPATKATLQSTVYTDTENRQTGAGDYLPRQEEGGERVPVNGRMHIAIPTKHLRDMVGEGRPIPDWLRPKALLAYAKTNGAYQLRGGKRKGQFRSAPVAVRGLYFFRVTFKSGLEGILARHPSDPRDQVYPMYVFVSRATIRKRFPAEQTVEQTVARVFEAEFEKALLAANPLRLL